MLVDERRDLGSVLRRTVRKVVLCFGSETGEGGTGHRFCPHSSGRVS